MADKPAAKQGDTIVGTDTHILLVPSPGGPVPTPTPMPFSGTLATGLSADVLVCTQPAAVQGSQAMNVPPHVPAAGPFQRPPSNTATVHVGTAKVLVNNKPAARVGDQAMTCNDPADAPQGVIVGGATVLYGD